MSGAGSAEGHVFADFFDGEEARAQRVRLEFEGDRAGGRLTIHLPDSDRPVVWPVDRVRLIPDQADRSESVFGLAGDHPARLRVRDCDLRARLLENCPKLRRRHRDPDIAKRLMKVTAAAVMSVAVMIFVLIPVMANLLAVMMPTGSERAFGETTYRQILAALNQRSAEKIRECGGSPRHAALEQMASRLAAGVEFPTPLSLHVWNVDEPNAFALPGGQIVVFHGLLDFADNPQEVAAVLAHEMGHVKRRDPTRGALRAAGSLGVLGLIFGDFAGGTVVLYLSRQLIDAKYSRSAEAASDRFAHQTLARAGLPTRPMADFFLRLRKEYGDATGLMSHLADHPDLEGRAEAARRADSVGQGYDPVLSPAEWRALRAACS